MSSEGTLQALGFILDFVGDVWGAISAEDEWERQRDAIEAQNREAAARRLRVSPVQAQQIGLQRQELGMQRLEFAWKKHESALDRAERAEERVHGRREGKYNRALNLLNQNIGLRDQARPLWGGR